MKNKKVKFTKKAWEEAGIKKGYLIRNSDGECDIRKEAIAPLVTGLIGGAAGMAGNWLYDKAKQGNWMKHYITGYNVPQEKINQLKQQLQQSEAIFANMRGISPELDRAIEEFKSKTLESLRYAEEENTKKGQGAAQDYGASLARQNAQKAQQSSSSSSSSSSSGPGNKDQQIN
jgi:hypothetical protein